MCRGRTQPRKAYTRSWDTCRTWDLKPRLSLHLSDLNPPLLLDLLHLDSLLQLGHTLLVLRDLWILLVALPERWEEPRAILMTDRAKHLFDDLG